MRTFAETVESGPFARAPVPSASTGSHAKNQVPIGMLVRTLQRELIPRMAQAHRPALASLSPQEVEAFTHEVLEGQEDAMLARLEDLRRRGVSDEALCIDLLTPSARLLGRMWDDDRCDLTSVTIGTGRLQRLLRLIGPGRVPQVGADVQALSVLLLLPPQEQHSFGLSMVADFFRGAGWRVSSSLGDQSLQPGSMLSQRHFDVVGISCGSHGQLAWLKQQIPQFRKRSRNPRVAVMVGGPVFICEPDALPGLGADLCVLSGREAPGMAERMARHARSLADGPAQSQLACR